MSVSDVRRLIDGETVRAVATSVARLAVVVRERDRLQSELVDARAEVGRLEDVVEAALEEFDELVEANASAAEERAAEQEEFADRQAWWEVRIEELEKENQELNDELDRLPDTDGTGGPHELTRLREELAAAREQAEQSAAEADAAFAELETTLGELAATQQRLADLDVHRQPWASVFRSGTSTESDGTAR